jgi:hypothetical protein
MMITSFKTYTSRALAVALEIVRHNSSGGVTRPKAGEMMPTIAPYSRSIGAEPPMV